MAVQRDGQTEGIGQGIQVVGLQTRQQIFGQLYRVNKGQLGEMRTSSSIAANKRGIIGRILGNQYKKLAPGTARQTGPGRQLQVACDGNLRDASQTDQLPALK